MFISLNRSQLQILLWEFVFRVETVNDQYMITGSRSGFTRSQRSNPYNNDRWTMLITRLIYSKTYIFLNRILDLMLYTSSYDLPLFERTRYICNIKKLIYTSLQRQRKVRCILYVFNFRSKERRYSSVVSPRPTHFDRKINFLMT